MAGQHVDLHQQSHSLRDESLPERQRSRRRPIDFQAVRDLVSMAEVLSLLNFHSASRRGDQVRGKCPLHVSENEQSRAFSANLSKNAYHCFAEKCVSKGNQLDLWVAATGLPPYESAVDLCEKLGKDVPYVQLPETAKRIKRTQ